MRRTQERAMPYRRVVTVVLVVLLLTVFTGLLVPPTVGEESGSGSAVVGNQAPTITSRTISTTVSGANQSSSPDLTVMTYYWFWVALSDDNSVNDIANITITLYDSSGSSGVFVDDHSYGFAWLNVSGVGTWKELAGGGWGEVYTYLDDSNSVKPDCFDTDCTGTTSGTWKFKAKMAKVASNVGSDDWTFKAYIEDDAAESATTTGGAAWFDFSYYSEYATAAASVSWTSLNPGASNSTATSPASGNNYVTVTAINHNSNIRVHGDADLVRTGGGGTAFPLENVYVGETSNAPTNDGVKLTTDYQTLWATVPAGTESTNKAAYYFITVPNPCIPGTYTFTWYATVVTT